MSLFTGGIERRKPVVIEEMELGEYLARYLPSVLPESSEDREHLCRFRYLLDLVSLIYPDMEELKLALNKPELPDSRFVCVLCPISDLLIQLTGMVDKQLSCDHFLMFDAESGHLVAVEESGSLEKEKLIEYRNAIDWFRTRMMEDFGYSSFEMQSPRSNNIGDAFVQYIHEVD
jgi:hypothetical protein